MKKIMILTHGDLCKGFNSALAVITAGSNSVDVLAINAEDNESTIINQLEHYISKFKDDQIIILTDIPFGSSTQFAMKMLVDHKNIFIVTGVNLALLLELVLSGDVDDIRQSIRDAIISSQQTLLFINDQLDNDETNRG